MQIRTKTCALAALLLMAGLAFFFILRTHNANSALESAAMEPQRGDAPSPAATPASSPSPGKPAASEPAAVVPPLERDAPFPGARVVEEVKTPLADGRTERVRILKTAFKYPLVRRETVAVPAPAGGREMVLRDHWMAADHLIVRLRPGTPRDALEELNRKHGAAIRRKLLAPGTYLVRIPAADAAALPRALARYRQEAALIAYAEPDYIVFADGTFPDDARFDELYGMHNTGQTGGTADADIDAPEAWDITTGSRQIKVGVIDTGIDYNHPDLAANIWSNPGETGLDGDGNDKRTNGIDDDGNGFVDDYHGWDFANGDNNPMDGHFHGTHVSGTIGGSGNNATGVTGVCWEVTLVPLKFLSDGGFGSTSDAVDAVYYANALGVNLTSNSWGGGGYSQAMKDAIDAADASGSLFVAAAGNSNSNNDLSPHYPSSYACPNVIAVAATDHDDLRASFSSYGQTSVHLGAPGVNTLSCNLNAGYRTASGTSMATPHVSGVCALLWSLDPGMSHADVRDRVLAAVDPVPSMDGVTITGGRLNAFNAVLFAAGPYLILSGWTVDDAAAGGTSGNGDTFINPGETIGLDVTLQNAGSQDTTSVTATLSLTAPDPYVTIASDTAAFGDLASRSSAAGDAQFLFDVDPLAVTPHEVGFTLTMQDGAGGVWTRDFQVTVYTSSQVGGTVTLATGGAPLAGAVVEYAGPVGGSAVTAADGTYAFTAIDGAYTVQAKAAGYLDSDAVAVVVPPDAAGVDFQMGNPEIDVTPVSLSASAEAGAATALPLNVANLGDAKLTWHQPPLAYDFTDSDGAGGPTFGWIDITATGTPITTFGLDTNLGPVPLGFSFRFFASTHETVRICSNGWLSFTSTWVSYTNLPLPDPGAPRDLIAVFWDDLDFRAGGTAYYQQLDAGTFVVSYHDVPYYADNAKTATFQVILHAEGYITLQYGQVDITNSCTIGMQDETGESGLQVAFDENYLHGNMAVRVAPVFGAGWLSAEPLSGVRVPGTNQDLSVTLDAAALDPGVYSADLAIDSDDPGEPRTLVPVTFTVTDAPRMTYKAVAFDEDGTAPSDGDGDGNVEPGETIELTVTATNTGSVDSGPLTGTLSSTDAGVNVLQDTSALPAAAPGETVANATAFVVALDSGMPDNHSVPFTFTVQDGAGRSWNLSFKVLAKHRLYLAGTVRDFGTGAPLPGVLVQTAGLSDLTDASGAYRIEGIPSGNRSVLLSKAGYSSASYVRAFPPDQTLDVYLGFPDIAVDPAALNVAVNEGEQTTVPVAIHSNGSLTLLWDVENEQSAYIAATSDDPGGPAFAWTSIAATGTEITGLQDDTNAGPFPIGFAFPFYGKTFTTFRVCSNGWLSFTSTGTHYSNSRLPYTSAPENIVAFFWDDLNFNAGGKAYYRQVDAQTLAVQFVNVPFYSDNSLKATCEARLSADGRMEFRYLALGRTTSCTVGLQNEAKDEGLQVVYNQTLLHNSMAIRLQPVADWMSVTPDDGFTTPGMKVSSLDVTFDAAGLAHGSYATYLVVRSNDLETPRTVVPVSLNVNGPPVLDSAPTATPNPALVGQAVQFGVAATDPEGDGLQYRWVWDDGSADGSGPNPTHVFLAAGVYDVEVTVSDAKGAASDPATVSVLVTPSADETELYLKRGKFVVNWKAHGAGEAADTFLVQGGMNPAGANASMAGATMELLVNGVSLGEVPLGENGVGSAGGAKAAFKSMNGTLSFAAKGGDLRAALGLANDDGAGALDIALTIHVRNAGLATERANAHAAFAFETRAGVASKGSFNYKTGALDDGLFFAAKTTAVEDKTGAHKITVKGFLVPPGGADLTPAGDVELTLGGQTITISGGSLASDGGVFVLPKGAHAELARFAIDLSKKTFTVVSQPLAATGLPPAGDPATRHNLPVRLVVPTVGDPVTFEATVELLRSSPTSKRWKR